MDYELHIDGFHEITFGSDNNLMDDFREVMMDYTDNEIVITPSTNGVMTEVDGVKYEAIEA